MFKRSFKDRTFVVLCHLKYSVTSTSFLFYPYAELLCDYLYVLHQISVTVSTLGYVVGIHDNAFMIMLSCSKQVWNELVVLWFDSGVLSLLQHIKPSCGLLQRGIDINRDILFLSVKKDIKQISHNVRECRALCDMNTVTHISLDVFLDPTGEFWHFPMCSFYFIFYLRATRLTVLPPRYFRALRDSACVPSLLFPPSKALWIASPLASSDNEHSIWNRFMRAKP